MGCNGPHSSHNWGNWTWDHNGAEVGWYDWMRDEPNDWHRQQCLTFLKLADPVGYGVYHGGRLVDLADSRGPAKNNLLKSLISDADDHECCDWPGPQYNDQWWIGATCNGPHSSHNWGNWTWDH